MAQLTQGPSPIEWTREFPNSNLYTVAIDATGVYAAGNCFTTKLMKDGSEVWYRGGNCLTMMRSISRGLTVDGTALYVTGQLYLAGNFWGFVSKADTDGNGIWADTIRGSDQYYRLGSEAIATDATGVYVAGQIMGALPDQTNNGQGDVFVRKYAHEGKPDCTGGLCGVSLWTNQFGWENSEYPHSIVSDGTAVYVAGSSHSPIDGIYARHGFLRKYDVDGNVLATLRLVGMEVTGLAVDATGLYAVGNVWGSGMDVFLRKYDSNLNELWTVRFGTTADDSSYGLASDGTGVYVTGNTYGEFPGYTSAGSRDVFVRKYNADGKQVWTYQFGTWDDDFGVAIVVDSTAVYVGGHDSVSPEDGFVVKLMKVETTIEQLATRVQALNAKQGVINSLDAKLQNVRDSLTAANAGQRQDAVNKLQAFINACEAQRATLGADADTLITRATEIITMLQ
jgi:hypothetical protein